MDVVIIVCCIVHLLAFVNFELILRRDAKGKHIDLKDFSYFQFRFIVRPLINILILKAAVPTAAMTGAVRLFALTHYLMICVIIVYQLKILKII